MLNVLGQSVCFVALTFRKTAQFDELLEKIGDNAGKVWQRVALAKPGLRGTVEQGTEEHAMSVHYARAISGEVMSGAADWTEDTRKDGVSQLLRYFRHTRHSVYIVAPAKESRRVIIFFRRSCNPQRHCLGDRSS